MNTLFLYPVIFLCEFVIFTSLYYLFKTETIAKLVIKPKNFSLILATILGLQLVAIIFLRQEVGDVRLFSAAGWWLRQGEDFYFIDQSHGQYPFFPFLIFIYAILNFINELLPMFTFSFYLKLFCLLPAVYFLSLQIAKNYYSDRKQEGKIAQLQFLTHPLTYTSVIFHGQTDVVLFVFLITGIVHLSSTRYSDKKIILEGIVYALSILTKTWSVVFFPAISKFISQTISIYKFYFLILLTIFVDIFIYTRLVGSSFRQVITAVFQAGGTVGIWGMSFVFPLVKNNPFVFFIILFVFLQIIILRQNRSIWYICLLTTLSVLIIIPKWGTQYLFWPLPFLFLVPVALTSRQMQIFTILAGFYALLNYINIAVDKIIISVSFINSFGFLLWVFLIYWFNQLLHGRNHTLDKVNYTQK